VPGRSVIIQTLTPLSVSYKAVLVHEFARPPKFALRLHCENTTDLILQNITYNNGFRNFSFADPSGLRNLDCVTLCHMTFVYLLCLLIPSHMILVSLYNDIFLSFLFMRGFFISLYNDIFLSFLLMRRFFISLKCELLLSILTYEKVLCFFLLGHFMTSCVIYIWCSAGVPCWELDIRRVAVSLF